MKWTRTELNTCTRWETELNGCTLVVEKTPGYDPAYAVFKKQETLHNASIWNGTVKDCKESAKKIALSQLCEG